MFPGATQAEVRHCLAVAEDDIAKAAQLVLHRQEAGQSITSNLTFLTVSKNSVFLFTKINGTSYSLKFHPFAFLLFFFYVFFFTTAK